MSILLNKKSMLRKQKNKIKFFYQILSDMKNNINTLVKDLYDNQEDLESFAKSLPTVLKSKYPDLKKLGILEKKEKWKITELGKEVLSCYEQKNHDKYKQLIASIIGSYNYGGFRPYAVCVKFLYLKYGIEKELKREEIVEYFALPVSEAMYFINNEKNSPFNFKKGDDAKNEAPRPYSYVINHLKNAGIILEKSEKLFLSEDVKDFLGIFFADVDDIPKQKTKLNISKYRIISRGTDQVVFRQELLDIYKGKCALTRRMLEINGLNLLEAAHIIPVSHGGSYEVSNGILMTPDLHKAFDNGAIAFDDNYSMLVCENVKEEEYLPKSKKINFLPAKKEKQPSLISIKYHRDYIFRVGVINSRK